MLKRNWSILWSNIFQNSTQRLFGLSGIVGLAMMLSFGCGYQFAIEGSGPVLGGGDQHEVKGPLVRLAVQKFKNNTFQQDLEFKLTRYVKQQFRVNAGAEILPKEAEADFLLKGVIVSATVSSLAFSGNITQEGRAQMVTRVTVENRKTGEIVWSQTATGTGDFFVGSDADTGGGQDQIQFNRVLYDRALEQAGLEIANQLANEFWVARDNGTFSLSSGEGEKVSLFHIPDLLGFPSLVC